jgi:hypothetical protein
MTIHGSQRDSGSVMMIKEAKLAETPRRRAMEAVSARVATERTRV